MKLSIASVKALGFVYKEHKIDYNKYGSIKLNAEPIWTYTYILANAGMVVVNALMFDYIKRLGYVEYTECADGIIKVFLNKKYFRDLSSKQEI